MHYFKKSAALISLLILTGCTVTEPDLGIHNGELLPCPKTPNCVSSQAVDKEHYIQPIHFNGTEQKVKQRLIKILETDKQAQILKVQDNYIRATFTSRLFRFVDDVEFYFLQASAGNTIIQVRSASRVGYSDFGVNRKRIERLRSQLLDEYVAHQKSTQK